MPGMLVPGDLERIIQVVEEMPDEIAWLRAHFRASEGALVSTGDQLFRIPTVVPATGNGQCVFYVDSRCMIHSVAPFGCSYFDFHMTEPEAQQRSMAAHQLIMAAWDPPMRGPQLQVYPQGWEEQVRYAKLHQWLTQQDLIVPPLRERRAACERELERVERMLKGVTAPSETEKET